MAWYGDSQGHAMAARGIGLGRGKLSGEAHAWEGSVGKIMGVSRIGRTHNTLVTYSSGAQRVFKPAKLAGSIGGPWDSIGKNTGSGKWKYNSFLQIYKNKLPRR